MCDCDATCVCVLCGMHACESRLGMCVMLHGGGLGVYITRRVGHNRISAPYLTVCMVISLLKIPYVHRIYL